MFDQIEKLKQQYTDKYVVVDGQRPELSRFVGLTGMVKTVNMSGRCLVQFDAYNNIAWYDINPTFLKVVDQRSRNRRRKRRPTRKRLRLRCQPQRPHQPLRLPQPQGRRSPRPTFSPPLGQKPPQVRPPARLPLRPLQRLQQRRLPPRASHRRPTFSPPREPKLVALLPLPLRSRPKLQSPPRSRLRPSLPLHPKPQLQHRLLSPHLPRNLPLAAISRRPPPTRSPGAQARCQGLTLVHAWKNASAAANDSGVPMSKNRLPSESANNVF